MGAFFSVFLGMGLLFTVFILRSLFQGQSKVLALFLIIPLVFVIVGAWGLYSALKGPKPKPAPGSGLAESISERASDPRKGMWFMPFFFSIFLMVGLGATYAILVRPALKLAQAGSWRETPCTIVSSNVGSHRGSEGGTTFSVNIVFRYEVNGKTFTGDRYDFMGGSSSGYDGKAQIVSRFPPGVGATCYVNPQDPTDAVLDRRFHPFYLIGLFPMLFVVIGVAGILWSLKKLRHPEIGAAGAPGGPGLISEPLAFDSGPAELRPQASPTGKLLGVILIATFWNGIVSVFVWQMVEGWRHGHPDGCLTVFMIPFVLVGLILVGAIGYQFLALFNPRVHLTLSRRAIPLGGTADIEWRLTGSVSRLQRLTVALEGREEATYRRGTSTSTDKSVFLSTPLADVPAGAVMAQGRTSFRVPEGSVPSFASANNKIIWTLKVAWEIKNWPDVAEEYTIAVLPLPQGGAP
jgi:hypothetical protein